jgi:V8-like Glu-specific endopeptidase
MLKAIGILLVVFFIKTTFAGDKVIYGEDNRVDVYASTNTMYQELAESTAAMIDKKNLIKKEKSYQIVGSTLSGRGMCKDERFANQITAAMCSGFLVGEDLLVTAGHCIKNQGDCDKYAWVFDYRLKYVGDKASAVDASAVYHCKEIVERKLSTFFGKDDYALIRLERKATDRRPLDFRRSGKIKKGTPIVVIGHPTGLPTKIADGAKVRDLKGKYFVGNLDTYGGNSGSAVFDATTGVIEGILVRGATDYVTRNGCRASNRIGDNEGRGEDVTYITNIKYLNNL